MRWFDATLYKRDAYSKDKLGHDLVDEVEAGTCIVRKAPVKAEPSNVEGNAFKAITRAFLTPTSAERFRGIASVEVLGRRYKLDNVTSLENGHAMLTCAYYKPEADDESSYHC